MFGYVFKIHVMGDEYNDQKPFYHSGIIYADTYAEAIEKLALYYREDDIISIEQCVCVTDSTEPIILPYEIIDKIIMDSYAGKDCKTGEEI